MILEKLAKTNPKQKLIKLASNDREARFIKKVCSDCQKGDVVVYALKSEDVFIAFIALSASKVDFIPCIQIEYLFVKEDFRKLKITELDNEKISTWLIKFSIEVSRKISDSIGIRWLVLQSDNKKLDDYYKIEHKFVEYIDKSKRAFLFLKIN